MERTTTELVAMKEALWADPANRETDPGSLFWLNAKTRKRLHEIDAQIAHNIAMKRAAEGRPVPLVGASMDVAIDAAMQHEMQLNTRE